MSQSPLPDAQTAFSNLFHGVHARALLGVVSARGYAPKTEKEANELLDLSAKIQAAREAGFAQKTASTQAAPYAQAGSALDRVLQGCVPGYATKEAQEATVSRRRTAASLAGNADVYNSVLALQADRAARVAAELPG